MRWYLPGVSGHRTMIEAFDNQHPRCEAKLKPKNGGWHHKMEQCHNAGRFHGADGRWYCKDHVKRY